MQRAVSRPLVAVIGVLVVTSLFFLDGEQTPSGDLRAAVEAPPPARQAGGDPMVTGGPGNVPPDEHHPDGPVDLATLSDGGRVIIHLKSMPRHLNYMTENSSFARRIGYAIHEFLLERDRESWEYVGRLARDWITEDRVRLTDGEELYGETHAEGDQLVVVPRSPGNTLVETRRVPASSVESVRQGTVYTFRLHENVRWHDGHPFDAHDVLFSWQCYRNPHVDCEAQREQMAQLEAAEVVDDHTIRFFCAEPYALIFTAFDGLQVVPAHLYDLSDPDNADRVEGIDPLGARQGSWVNDHPNNVMWIGLGPYRITSVSEQAIDAERFDGYFDPERAGHVDAVRWRHIPDDNTAKVALLNGELDVFDRISSQDYFGEFCSQQTFLDSHYRSHVWLPSVQYIAWNTRRPQLRERDVRLALAHAYDVDEIIASTAHGLGVRVTGTAAYLSPFYDHSIEPVPFNLDTARELLDDAGWYDRDGDGIREKDGVALRFEFLVNAGNEAAVLHSQKMQESYSHIGVKVDIAARDFAVMLQRAKDKDFDAVQLSWTLDPENDPVQLWHSSAGEGRGSNYPGYADARSDELIGLIQRELDVPRRAALWHELLNRIHAAQPYLFTYLVPRKVAIARRLRNVKAYGLDPGYDVRDWFVQR